MTQTTTKATDERLARFVNELERLERGELAQLRRGLGGQDVYWIAGLYARTGYGEASKMAKDALQIVAGLYALKPQARDEGEESNLPDAPEAAAEAAARAENAPSIGKLMGRLYVIQGARPSTEKRFLALLDADRDGLNYQMRQAVMLLSTEDLTPDWVRLAGDLLHWSDHVRRRWAKDFYSEIYREPPQGSAKPDTATDTAQAGDIPAAAPLFDIPTNDQDDEGEETL